MTTITICQRKGGVGKSTATLNLSCVLGSLGYKVLIIDLDDQQNTTKSISSIIKSDVTIEDLLLKDGITLNDAVIDTSWQNVFILPASSNLSGVVKYLDGEVGGHSILKEKLNTSTELGTSTSTPFDNAQSKKLGTSNQFDFVFIDTSPSLNILVLNALCASQYMFIPLSSKYLSIQGLKQTIDAFKKVAGRLNPDLKLLGIGFVNHDKRNVLANEVIDQVFNKYPEESFKTIIGINIKIEEAQVQKQSIITYAPKDRGSLEYQELGKEILTRLTK